jgi:hypothetical protein
MISPSEMILEEARRLARAHRSAVTGKTPEQRAIAIRELRTQLRDDLAVVFDSTIENLRLNHRALLHEFSTHLGELAKEFAETPAPVAGLALLG